MGNKFPSVTYKETITVAKKLGFYFKRQGKGSHEIWWRDIDGKRTVIPKHSGKIIKRKTLSGIIKDFEITTEEFIKLL